MNTSMDGPFKVNGVASSYCVDFTDGAFSVQVSGQQPLPLCSRLNFNSEFDPNCFETHLLYSPGLGEGESKMVFHRYIDRDGGRVREKRIGWIIPVSALDSDLHSYKDDIHFLKYAYLAAKACLEADWGSVKYNDVDVNLAQFLTLSDIFPEFTAVLVVSLNTLTEGAEFDVDRAVPSMMANGYIPLNREPSGLYEWDFDRSSKVFLEMVSPAPNEFLVINNLLRAFARAKDEPVLQFFLLYQIVELLIERVMRYEYSEIASSIISAGQDSAKLKLAIDGVGKSVSEAERLKLLNSKYVRSSVDTAHLDIFCCSFLDAIGRTDAAGYKRPKPGLHGCLYQVRNAIFHGFRDVPQEAMDALKAVVKELLVVISKMLSRYHSPDVHPAEVSASCVDD